MDNPRKRILLIRIADIADCSLVSVREAHMAIDRRSFFRRQLHEILNLVYRLASVPAKMITLVNRVEGDLLPDPIDLFVPILCRVEIDLADIVKQCGYCKRFFRQRCRRKKSQLLRVIIYIQRVLAKAAGISAMIVCAGRSCKKVLFFARLCSFHHILGMQYSTFGEPCKRKDGYKTAVRKL